MSWWKTALYDTCSIITLDKLLLESARLARHFPTTIMALEESFTADQLRKATAARLRKRVTICPLPSTRELKSILSSAKLSKALADADKLVYAAAVHHQLFVVSADKRLAKTLQAQGMQVSNIALILRELVMTKKLLQKACENLLRGLAARKEFLLGTPTPTWADLRDSSFPD